jgi:Domain of unknown function (DUF4337)
LTARAGTGDAGRFHATEELVESTEIDEHIRGHREHRHSAAADERFSKLTGIYVGIVAMLLAITTLGSENATKRMLAANIQASDTYNYYQAKYLRQTEYQIAADLLETQIATPGLPDAAKTGAEAAIRRYRDTARRYESDPARGEGKKQLMAKARDWEARRDHAALRLPNFEFAGALYQIAIVLGSVSIVAASRALVKFSGLVAILATLLMINGYFLLLHLPLE